MPKRILILGSGGREHALAWRAAHEGHEVIVAPGSDGISQDAESVALSLADHAAIIELARARQVDAAVIGPEAPLVAGLADDLRTAGVPAVGPSRAAAALEGSKAVAKAFMARHGIPTAAFATVRTLGEGEEALAKFSADGLAAPVVKADGLAAGKGVVVPESFDEARAALRSCLVDGKFGDAGQAVVLEERLLGEEASMFVLTDGTRTCEFVATQDHKRLGDGDQGPNTGGMGAYGPAPVVTDAVREQVAAAVVEPTLAGLRQEGMPFVGVLFLGLMIDGSGQAKVIEYNVRFGDPEVQPLMFGLRDPLVERLVEAANGELSPGVLRGAPAATVVLASAGYPESSSKGDPIEGLARAAAHPEVKIFHAGTRAMEGGGFATNGGRVLGVCARADTLEAAIKRAYGAADELSLAGGQMRRDIGARALGRSAGPDTPLLR